MELDKTLAEHLAGWGRARRGWDIAGCLAQLAKVKGRAADDVAMAWVRLCGDDQVRSPGAFPNLAGPHWSEKVAPPKTPGPLKPFEACPGCGRLAHVPDDVCIGRPAPAPDSPNIAAAKAALDVTKQTLCSHGPNCVEHRPAKPKPATTEETSCPTINTPNSDPSTSTQSASSHRSSPSGEPCSSTTDTPPDSRGTSDVASPATRPGASSTPFVDTSATATGTTSG